VCSTGVYAALLHGRWSHLLSASAANLSATSVRLDSPWFAAPAITGQSSCRVQFAVSSNVQLLTSSPPALELRLHRDANGNVIWPGRHRILIYLLIYLLTYLRDLAVVDDELGPYTTVRRRAAHCNDDDN